MFKCEDLGEYGPDAAFQKIVDELRALHREGIECKTERRGLVRIFFHWLC